jgi:hypothetical protein
MNCRFFKGKLSEEEREFLVGLLEKNDARTMLKSWVEHGQIGKPSGHGIDLDKIKAVEILKDSKAFCVKCRVNVYALDTACAYYKERS